jgi:glycosyltransferase involved in cell wall biosynthesis
MRVADPFEMEAEKNENTQQEKELPCIVIATFNRPESLFRLLTSVALADYGGLTGIRLVISIDGGGSQGCLSIAEKFQWNYGVKEVISQSSNLGLKAHILFCGDLCFKYGSVIVLEDDLYVSPCFYKYAHNALTFYQTEPLVAGISLYNYEVNEINNLPFTPLHDGFHNYFVQFAASWGQAWSRDQWGLFRRWLVGKSDSDLYSIPIAERVKKWSNSSWKKFFIGYLVDQNKYFAYPRISYSSNLSEVGTHLKRKTGLYQASLAIGTRSFSFSKPAESLSRYDSFYEIEPSLVKKISREENSEEFDLDLYGLKEQKDFKSRMVYTSRPKSKSACARSFSNELEPLELNIIHRLAGEHIFYTDVANIDFNNSLAPVSLFLDVFRIGTIKRLIQISVLFLFRRFMKK